MNYSINDNRTDYTKKTNYFKRVNRVIDFIEEHLRDELTLQALAEVACFSKFHFHRIFQSVTGEGIGAFVMRLRYEKAADLLKQHKDRSITDIALSCGFPSSSAFINGFRLRFKISPGKYRKNPVAVENPYIQPPLTQSDNISVVRRYEKGCEIFHFNEENSQHQILVKEVPQKKLAYHRYIGPYKGDQDLFSSLWETLITWAGPRDLLSHSNVEFLTIYHDNPDITDENRLRVSVCISVPGEKEIQVNENNIGILTLKRQKVAFGRFVLGPKDYSKAWGWMYGVFLPRSGYLPADSPAYESYPPELQNIDDKDEDGMAKQTVDICIPVIPA